MIEDGKEQENALVRSNNTLKGMRMRDEFICPITYALMREPTVASDGHTYEKGAIEKWLKSNQKSPRTGEPMDVVLIPNLNLKKLITDILNEGGQGFYTKDISNSDRMFEFSPEKILVLECLGPPESDWNQQSFEVSANGCIGGRKYAVDDGPQPKEMILFKDITVSRKHFEITQAPDSNGKGKNYYIRDLGSAGGTFIRIMYGTRKQLHPGMIVLLGKHQFTVSSIDDGHLGAIANTGTVAVDAADSDKKVDSTGAVRKGSLLSPDAIMSIVESAERILADIGRGDAISASASHDRDDLSARLKSLTLELSSHLPDDNLPSEGKEEVYQPNSASAKRAFQNRHQLALGQTMGPSNFGGGSEFGDQLDPNNTTTISSQSDAKEPHTPLRTSHPGAGHKFGFGAEDIAGSKGVTSPSPLPAFDYSNRRCVLTCCAPDGSPLQGQSFAVGSAGGVMGRKQSNAVALLVKMKDAHGEERVASVDSAISSEHARVEFDAHTGAFFIADGTASKPSTNGTWFRMSGPHQESPPHLLSAGSEVLIGTVRFQVRESMTISERKVDEK